jgi:hypothetical protein
MHIGAVKSNCLQLVETQKTSTAAAILNSMRKARRKEDAKTISTLGMDATTKDKDNNRS